MAVQLLTTAHLLAFAFMTLHVMSRTDLSAMTRVAWMLAMLLLPVGGIILYFLYGEIRFGGAIGQAHHTAEVATRDMVRASGAAPDLSRYGPASGLATAINGFGVTDGNHAELLPGPDEQRERLIADIDAAKSFINVFYYIWLDDHTGRNVAQALIRAVQRGVKVRAGIDAIGSRQMPSSQTWKDMIAAGVETMVALPIGNPLISIYFRRPDLRNHRKITVIDGHICHCGSQNCADPAFLPKAKYGPWVDIMVRLEGPVARQMDLLFAQTWFENKPLDLASWQYDVAPLPNGITAQVVGTGPTIDKGTSAQLISHILGEARREIVITTPYFIPGDVVVDAIMAAAIAGIDVTMIVPHRNDSGLVGPASRAFYPQLTKAGVKILEFNGGLLHSKTLTVDREITFFGSTNLDIRSFDLNFENDILVRNTELATAIHARQMEYAASSTPVKASEVAAWPIWRRIWYNSFSTIMPLI